MIQTDESCVRGYKAGSILFNSNEPSNLALMMNVINKCVEHISL
jgi:hypothetical protein